MDLPAQVTDPDGRVVELTVERWEHIAAPDGHPELAGLHDAVLRAVAEPDVRRPGREPNEEWFFFAGIGRSRVAAGGRSIWRGPRVDRDRVRPKDLTMSIEIGDISFDRVRYDEAADVLYLHRGDATDAVEFDASPEGHALRFDAQGQLVGVTIVRPRWYLEHDGQITITIPERVHLSRQTLAGALTG